MTKEEKQLLLQDFCTRLPYGVKFNYGGYDGCDYKVEIITSTFINDFPIEDCKPYLRPMSSMTEEEKEKLKSLYDAENVTNESICFLEGGTLEEYEAEISFIFCYSIVVWLLENHFDFMGLITKGLAIEVTEDNNPYKE